MRNAIAAALDALESGDQYGTEQILAAALDEDPGRAPSRRLSCPCCGMNFEWPGQLDHHLRVIHPGHQGVAA